MSEIIRIDAGLRMSEAVIFGGKVYTAGVVADSAHGQGMFEQTQDVLSQIDAVLAQAGTDKTRILKVTIWVADMAQFAEMNRAWDAWAVPGKTPARATVEAKLADAGWLVEMMVEAAL